MNDRSAALETQLLQAGVLDPAVIRAICQALSDLRRESDARREALRNKFDAEFKALRDERVAYFQALRDRDVKREAMLAELKQSLATERFVFGYSESDGGNGPSGADAMVEARDDDHGKGPSDIDTVKGCSEKPE